MVSNKKKIAVIFGGQSSEHDVSRISAQSVINNINKEKYDIAMVGITKDGRWLHYEGPVEKLSTGEWEDIALKSEQKRNNSLNIEGVSSRDIFKTIGAEDDNSKIDVVFPVLHGCNGEDGTIQGFFEISGIPYVGPGVLGSALGMDKAYAKIIFDKEGIPQAKCLVYDRKKISKNIDEIILDIESKIIYPCFVKPSNAGSSVGVSKAHDRAELIKGLELAAKNDIRVLVEEFIDGREVECAVLGNDEPMASLVGEIIPGSEFYDYNDKYIGNKSKTVIPADLADETVQKIREYSVKAFKSLDCAGLSRVDFFVHKATGEIYLNEINTLPGFTSISMYPKLWEASGIPYGELIERLIGLAFERYQDNKRQYE